MLRDRYWEREMRKKLVWMPEIGIGSCSVETPFDLYTKLYVENYKQLGQTEMGRALNKFRVEFVKRYHQGEEVFDYGAGAGDFIKAWGAGAVGYDMFAAGEGLRDMGKFRIPEDDGWEAVTFWDSLEHLKQPEEALMCSRKWVFISMPIYLDVEHVLRSKHYKPGEHLWYWTHEGLLRWMQFNGFTSVGANSGETDLGREGIGTFAFRRVNG